MYVKHDSYDLMNKEGISNILIMYRSQPRKYKAKCFSLFLFFFYLEIWIENLWKTSSYHVCRTLNSAKYLFLKVRLTGDKIYELTVTLFLTMFYSIWTFFFKISNFIFLRNIKIFHLSDLEILWVVSWSQTLHYMSCQFFE